MRIPLHQMRQQHCFWIPSMGVFEMHNAKNQGVLLWRSKCTYLCTKYASSNVFGYLAWVCFKLTMSNVVRFWHGARHAHTSGTPPDDLLQIRPRTGPQIMHAAVFHLVRDPPCSRAGGGGGGCPTIQPTQTQQGCREYHENRGMDHDSSEGCYHAPGSLRTDPPPPRNTQVGTQSGAADPMGELLSPPPASTYLLILREGRPHAGLEVGAGGEA